MNIKDRLKNALNRLPGSESSSEEDADFNRRLGFKRLLFLLPFLIIAVILLLMSLK